MIKFYYYLLHAHLTAYDLHMYIITDNDMIGQVWEYKIIKLLPSFLKTGTTMTKMEKTQQMS